MEEEASLLEEEVEGVVAVDVEEDATVDAVVVVEEDAAAQA